MLESEIRAGQNDNDII